MPPPPLAPPLPAAAAAPPSAQPAFSAVTPSDLASLRGLFSPTLHLLPLNPPLVQEVARVVNESYRLRRGWTNEADLVSGQRVTEHDLQRELKTADGGGQGLGVYVVVDYADEEEDEAGDEAEHALAVRGGRATVLGCVEVGAVRRTLVGEVAGGREAGYVGMLTVRHEWQGRGLGRWLMRWSERYCRRKGVDRILMCVLEPREEIIRWYQRCGFRKTTQKVDARPFIEGKGEQLLVDCCFVLLEKVFLQHSDETAPAFTASTAQRHQIQFNSTT